MAHPKISPSQPTASPELARLRQQLQAHLPELAQHYRVKSLGLFGSYVRHEQTPQSDLDVLVEFDEPPSLFQFIRLEQRLSDVLRVKVDLVMKDSLKPAIGRHILREVVPV